MGGRGNKPIPLNEREQEYKRIGTVAGIKVLDRLNKNLKKKIKKNLPDMSNTPNTSYIQLDNSGKDLKKVRIYGSDRLPSLDIDFDHSHNGIIPHAHIWKNGRKVDDRELTKKEIKVYSKLRKKVMRKFVGG